MIKRMEISTQQQIYDERNSFPDAFIVREHRKLFLFGRRSECISTVESVMEDKQSELTVSHHPIFWSTCLLGLHMIIQSVGMDFRRACTRPGNKISHIRKEKKIKKRNLKTSSQQKKRRFAIHQKAYIIPLTNEPNPTNWIFLTWLGRARTKVGYS